MERAPDIWVVDASTWIDLGHGCIVSSLFRLPVRVMAPDVIVAQLKYLDSGDLRRKGLEEVELDSRQVAKIYDLRQRHRRPGTDDLFALALAIYEEAILLTGDAALRAAAREEGVMVHGSLWVLDRLVEEGHLSPQEAITALRNMLAQGARLPSAECARRLRRWTGGDGQNGTE